MTLAKATFLDGRPLALPGSSPFPAAALSSLKDIPFLLPCCDPWLHDAGTRAHAYLDNARQAWIDEPEYLDILAESSPCRDLKRTVRDLYLHHWQPWLAAERVLDIGCGVGRFATYFLDRGADVIGVDGDMQSLCRCAWHAAGRPGRLDLYWTSVHTLPEIAPCDLAVACEVLCYVPDVGRALRAIVARLRPGGTLLLSVEARWGWALSVDAPGGGLDVALAEPVGTDTGVLDLTDDRWVRIYQRDQLHAELSAAGLRVEGIWPMLYTLDGPLESLVPSTATTAELLAIEQRCRDHPIWSPLNRVWTAAAVKA